MPYNFINQQETIDAMLQRLESSIYVPLCEIGMEVYVTPEPVTFNKRMTGEKKTVKKGDLWGKLWDCGWFHLTGIVPEDAKGKKVVIYIDIHGEMCVFDSNGTPVQGLTSGSSVYNPALESPKKREYVITENAVGGEIIDIWADAGCNDLFGKCPGVGEIEYADISVCRDNVKSLYYDAYILSDLLKQLDENSARYHRIRQSLFDAACVLWDYTDDEIEKAAEILKKELDKKCGDCDFSLSAIGHAHMDLAWQWPIRETKRKGLRTFSTVLRNMERYPDYIFGASQPQLYDWVKADSPELYSQIKERIKDGRWEAQGAMWVEADTNVSGGEALIRQLLYGKKFFKEEFDKDMEVLWLPDVFGYNASLPQMLKKSGVPYFMTIKLSWSRHNNHPHHTFKWEGIDGSEVLVHMPPEGEYNSTAMPWAIKKIENEYIDKCVSDEALLLFGIGDGGGGPGECNLEALKREKNLSGLVPVKQEQSIEFFHRLEAGKERYKTFKGELYLEKHQGTYTTQARNKKYNRKMEKLLREAEFALIVTGADYPQEELEAIWKEVLLYQFHDILPGSSIKRVYDESLERYEILKRKTEDIIKSAYGDGDYIINSLSWDRNEWVKKDNKWYNVTVPAMGSAKFENGIESKEIKQENTGVLENECVKVTFDIDGSIVSVWDKIAQRECIEANSNRFAIYYDDGDCWDFSESYRERAPRYFELVKVDAYIDGPVKMLKQEYIFGNSKLWQTVSITDGSPVVTFDTEVDWNESKKMLRTAFYTNIITDNVTCDIQYGAVSRPMHNNTTWDMAKYEICAHKYIDLSENNYGVALINDCKYGHYVKDGVMDLNLLRSPDFPGEAADIAMHSFKYAIYPHNCNWADSDVIHKSYEFNQLMQFGHKIDWFAKLSNSNVIIESIKKAEYSDSVIIRMYESKGETAETALEFNREIKSAHIVDLTENNETAVNLDSIKLGRFEIVTIKVEL